jgi:hypothetical protein
MRILRIRIPNTDHKTKLVQGQNANGTIFMTLWFPDFSSNLPFTEEREGHSAV